ncbi:putative nucleotidyltransferase, ribonuclease H [Tanacetum coccineum]
MVGRRRTRNVNQLHEEPDPRDIEAPRQNHNEPENDDSEEEYNPFHVIRSSESSDEEAHYQHNNRRNNRSQRGAVMRVDIPMFEGRIQPDEFIDWIHTVERVFDYQDVRDDLKVKIVAIKLKKHAFVWWEQLKLKRAHENKPRIRTWEKMKRELRKKFLPDGYLQEAFLQLHDFAQCDLSVADYKKEFDHLMLNDVYKLATKFEKQLKEKEGRKSATYGVSRVPSQGYAINRASSSQKSKSIATKASQTPQTHDVGAGPSRTKPKSVQCFKCKGFGHISSNCPNQRVFTLVEENVEDEYDIPPTFDEPHKDEHEDITYGDTGELLVIWRALHVESNRDEAWLCNNIFHTRCTSNRKVCDVIIDSGSCENVVSESMVKKLPLTTEKHPHPYKLSWLNKGKSIQVDRRCLVNFFIGEKYRDEVWCDVVPMDACHLLLGRTWQFDRQTVHDGLKNTYAFVMNGVKIVLGPSKLKATVDANKGEGNLFISKSEFSEALQQSKVAFALVLKEVGDETRNSLISGKGLLNSNDGSCGGKGRRGGSMAGRGGGWLAKRSMVSNEGRGGGGLVVRGVNREDCLDGCDGAGRGEVNCGGVVLGVFKR